MEALSPLNLPLMDWRKRMTSAASAEEDERAVVKAAAWAWYQHGSGDEGRRPGREFDIARGGAARSPRAPSRYQLEALAKVSGSLEPGPGTSNSLLDLYEIERITRELDRLIAASRPADKHRAPRKAVEKRKVVATRTSGFWMQHAVAICGTRGDVVEARVLAGRRPSKAATVV